MRSKDIYWTNTTTEILLHNEGYTTVNGRWMALVWGTHTESSYHLPVSWRQEVLDEGQEGQVKLVGAKSNGGSGVAHVSNGSAEEMVGDGSTVLVLPSPARLEAGGAGGEA